MKRFFTSAAIFCSLTLSLFAQSQNDPMQQRGTSARGEKATAAENWHQCLFEKEGWVEGGAEWLLLSSSLTPVFTNSDIQSQNAGQNINFNNTSFNIVNRKRESVNPEYNSGYSIFFRYRGPSDSDLSLKYHYLRNNGDGSLNREDTFSSNSQDPIPDLVTTLNQRDRGHLHSHMHIADLFAGTAFPLVSQMLLRLSGGLSFNDFHMFFQVNDVDSRTDRTSTTTVDFNFSYFYKEHRRFWGLGPKGQIDFEYLMLPISWNHSLNFTFWAQFALLYGKNWARGKLIQNNITVSSVLNQSSVNFIDGAWEHRPNFQLIPNINMDFGLNYRWESSGADLIYNWAVGYRIYTYWNLNEVFSPQATLGGVDNNSTTLLFNHDDKLIYGGPYIRFSIAY